MQARHVVADRAQRTPVPRWVLGAFTVVSAAGILAGLFTFAFLYREAEHGHLTVEVAATLFVVSQLAMGMAGIWLFRTVALPPVVAQTFRLQEMLDQQQEINRRQRDFLVHVHHELRTPVTVLYGAMELLRDHGDGLEAEQRARLRAAAYRNAETLTHLVEDLTTGVDEALPGLSLVQDANSWSSRPRHLQAAEGT